MRNGRRHQQGLSGSGWFMVIILIFGAASVGLKVVPYYLDHNTIHGQILSLLENPELREMGPNRIHRELERMLRLNNIRDFDTKDKLEIQKGAGTLTMDFKYEVREKLFWNVDVVLTFEEHYEKVL